MITDSSITIDAPAALVWAVFTEVERWPDWTASVTSLRPLDGAELAPGRRYELKQPRMPKLVWAVTELQAGTSWSWEQRSPGGLTVASHEVVPQGSDQTLVRQRIDQRGPIGATVGLLMRRLTVRYLELEAQGLKARAEELARHDAATP